MRKLLLIAAAALVAGAAQAQSLQVNRGQVGTVGTPVTATDPSGNTGVVILPSTSVRPGPMTPMGYQQISSLSSATGLTVPPGATVAYIIPEAQAVRCRDDGTSPTASVGQPVAVGAQLVYSASLSALKCIEQTASAKLNVWYFQ